MLKWSPCRPRIIFKKQLHWIVWVAILLCIYGSYLLSSNQSLDIQKSDSLLFIAALFFALHIICIDIFIKRSIILALVHRPYGFTGPKPFISASNRNVAGD